MRSSVPQTFKVDVSISVIYQVGHLFFKATDKDDEVLGLAYS